MFQCLKQTDGSKVTFDVFSIKFTSNNISMSHTPA